MLSAMHVSAAVLTLAKMMAKQHAGHITIVQTGVAPMVSRTDAALLIFTVLNITVCSFVLIANSNVEYVPTATAAPVTVPFDHSGCQYPDRTTNPPNSCDNSDPCDPAQTKGGSGDCVAEPVPDAPAPEYVEPLELMQGK